MQSLIGIVAMRPAMETMLQIKDYSNAPAFSTK
jgi:hypothetical protein